MCPKFCVNSGLNGTKTLEMLAKRLANNTLSKTNVYMWHERFKSGRESVVDDKRRGRPSTSKTDEIINKIKKMLAENRKMIIKELTEDLGIAYGSVQDILTNDLDFMRIAATLIGLIFIHNRTALTSRKI